MSNGPRPRDAYGDVLAVLPKADVNLMRTGTLPNLGEVEVWLTQPGKIDSARAITHRGIRIQEVIVKEGLGLRMLWMRMAEEGGPASEHPLVYVDFGTMKKLDEARDRLRQKFDDVFRDANPPASRYVENVVQDPPGGESGPG
jgi:hypothetical protein